MLHKAENAQVKSKATMSNSEITFSNPIVLEEIFSVSFQRDTTAFQNIRALSHFEGNECILLNHDDGKPLFIQLSRTRQTVSTTIGAKPRDGSSVRSNFGSAIKALPMANICCSPPLSVPATWFIRFFKMGKRSHT